MRDKEHLRQHAIATLELKIDRLVNSLAEDHWNVKTIEINELHPVQRRKEEAQKQERLMLVKNNLLKIADDGDFPYDQLKECSWFNQANLLNLKNSIIYLEQLKHGTDPSTILLEILSND